MLKNRLSRYLFYLCLLTGTGLLTGCARKSVVPPVRVYSPPPPAPAPTLRNQCKRLYDEQLFVRAHRHDMSEWQYNQKSKQLHDEYQRLGCYRVRHHVRPRR